MIGTEVPFIQLRVFLSDSMHKNGKHYSENPYNKKIVFSYWYYKNNFSFSFRKLLDLEVEYFLPEIPKIFPAISTIVKYIHCQLFNTIGLVITE